jgi:hypothetical protein
VKLHLTRQRSATAGGASGGLQWTCFHKVKRGNALGSEHDVFSRRRDPWLQLVHRLRPQQPGDARGLDQSDRIARRTSYGQCPHVESARSDLRAVTAAASPIADQLSKAGWTWGCSSHVDSTGRVLFTADAHRDNGKRFHRQRRRKADRRFSNLNLWRLGKLYN